MSQTSQDGPPQCSPDVVKGRRLVVAAIVGAMLALLGALVHGVEPIEIVTWLVVFPALLAMGVALTMFIIAFVVRALR